MCVIARVSQCVCVRISVLVPACVCVVPADLGDGMLWISAFPVFSGVLGFSGTDTVMHGPMSPNSSCSFSSCVPWDRESPGR